MSIQPRRTCFTGPVLSAGLWFDARLLGEEAARRRVLAAWKPGSGIHRAGGGLLLLWANARTIAAGTARGSLVVRMGGVLSATPLNARELERLAPPLSSLIVIEGGMCRAVALGLGTREDPGAWVDFEGFAVAATLAVAAPPPGPVTFAPGAQAPRQIFGVDPIDGVPRPAKPVGGIRGWLAAFQAARPALTGSGVPLPRRLADFLERLAAIRYSRHFAGLLRQFETGDLDTALRNAIPLGGVEASLQKARLPSLSPPRPRADLSIQLERRGVERSIGLETRFLELLRSYYRSAFEQLAARHRHDEAAFVLTELLQCHEEAVSFLETHGKLERAAQLAEARGLTPALVVRQWFIAGDRRRACLIARRTRAFAEAVALLERDDGAGAEEMRQAWAEQLAASGEYQAAVEVVWSIPSLRATAGPWLENAIAIGGPMGAHALARKAWLMPEAFAAVRAKLTALLDDASLEGAGARRTFAFSLRYGGGPTPQTRTLMRPAIRAVCRDVAMGFTGKALEFHSLIRYAGDASLAADLPGVPAMVENPQTVFSLRADAADSGPTALRHAVWTPGGQILVAAGEGGCRLIDRDGRVTARFAQPCDIIVPSDSGAMALTLARRGEVWKIGRLDLLRRRGQPWCDARLDSFAPHYDGSLWFVGIDGTLHALDATAAGFESIWDVPQAGERIISLDRGGDFLQAQVASGTETEWWRFELPSLTLRHRSSNLPAPLSPYAEVTYGGGIAKVEAEGAVHLELAGSQHAAATIGDYRLVVCDDRGRLIAVDLATRSLLRNLRI